jgi:hypothetical protein
MIAVADMDTNLLYKTLLEKSSADQLNKGPIDASTPEIPDSWKIQTPQDHPNFPFATMYVCSFAHVWAFLFVL